jgi:hypothetical protein
MWLAAAGKEFGLCGRRSKGKANPECCHGNSSSKLREFGVVQEECVGYRKWWCRGGELALEREEGIVEELLCFEERIRVRVGGAVWQGR